MSDKKTRPRGNAIRQRDVEGKHNNHCLDYTPEFEITQGGKLR